MLRRLLTAALFGFAGVGAGLAQVDPASLPARDAHDGLLIAADPYTDPTQYKARFGKKTPYEVGILAMDVYFRNDTDKPIRMDLESIRLLLAPPDVARQRFGAISVEDVADRILHKGGPNPTTPRRPISIPGRGPNKSRNKELNELVMALRPGAFEMDILPPRSSVHGFFFFDVNHRYDWLPYAKFYVPDLKFMDTKQALLFFEVDLSTARPR